MLRLQTYMFIYTSHPDLKQQFVEHTKSCFVRKSSLLHIARQPPRTNRTVKDVKDQIITKMIKEIVTSRSPIIIQTYRDVWADSYLTVLYIAWNLLRVTLAPPARLQPSTDK
uniref:SFRICE_002600 n=1 Tax=Spodoptera frugiperda TaxID=7108 RepID=A0A2H1WHE3_SPOFR